MFEFKCIQKYELAQRASNANLLQLFRVRAQEGFYLAKITHDTIKSSQKSGSIKSTTSSSSQSPSKKSSSSQNKPTNYVRITLYFKKHFTQTLTIIYKVSYVIARANTKSDTTTTTTVSNDPPSGDSGEQVSNTPTKSSRNQVCIYFMDINIISFL